MGDAHAAAPQQGTLGRPRPTTSRRRPAYTVRCFTYAEALDRVGVLPPSTDYTDLDFDAPRVRLIALLKSVFPDWSDFDVASFGNVLLEMYCFVGGVLG